MVAAAARGAALLLCGSGKGAGSCVYLLGLEVWAGDGSVNNGIPGYTTYRLSLKLFGDAQNVYSIYGKSGSMMKFPAAKQVQPPLGTNVSLPQLSCLCCCLTTLTDCVFRAHLI